MPPYVCNRGVYPGMYGVYLRGVYPGMYGVYLRVYIGRHIPGWWVSSGCT